MKLWIMKLLSNAWIKSRYTQSLTTHIDVDARSETVLRINRGDVVFVVRAAKKKKQ